MKKELLMVCAALAFVGCDKSDQGGMGSDSGIDTSTPSTLTNTSGAGSSSTLTNTNQLPQSAPQQSAQQPPAQPSQPQQGSAPTPPTP